MQSLWKIQGVDLLLVETSGSLPSHFFHLEASYVSKGAKEDWRG